MTTVEIQKYIYVAISSRFEGFTSESGEVETSEGGDGRFSGKVFATRYSGLIAGKGIFLAIGESAEGVQVVKLGRSECLSPGEADLDLLLLKELGMRREG